MRRRLLWLVLVQSSVFQPGISQTVAIGDVPACARTCLSSSTAYATECAQIDVKCLCNSQDYVSALSCCLVKTCNSDEQQIAIKFNVQECAAVNATAPNFIGCSPFSIASGGASVQQSTAGSASAQTPGILTLSGNIVTEVATFTNTVPMTESSFNGEPLLTGSCASPYFAQVTGLGDSTVLYPQMGCAATRDQCCPFSPEENGVLTECPGDYFTTSGRCCPTGFKLFYTNLGAAPTPCYSTLPGTYVPVTSPTINGLTMITDQVFSRAFVLASGSTKSSSLSPGVIAGIAVATTFLLLAAGLLLFCIKRRRSAKRQGFQSRPNTSTFPPEEPRLTSGSGSRLPQELASPEMTARSPAAIRTSTWPYSNPPSSPPAYDNPKGSGMSVETAIPQELPGSTYIHEHHPAYTESQSELSSVHRSPPRTPIRSETGSTRSPVLSPSPMTPLRTHSPISGEYFTRSPQQSSTGSRLADSPTLSTPEGRRTPRFHEENIQ